MSIFLVTLRNSHVQLTGHVEVIFFNIVHSDKKVVRCFDLVCPYISREPLLPTVPIMPTACLPEYFVVGTIDTVDCLLCLPYWKPCGLQVSTVPILPTMPTLMEAWGSAGVYCADSAYHAYPNGGLGGYRCLLC